MDKRTGLIVAFLLCVCMTAVFVLGCGSGGTARLENPLDFFDQTREKMQAAASFRMSGEMVAEFTGVPGMESMTVDYDMMVEQKGGGETLARMDMGYEGPPSFDIVAYLTGDRMYMEMPGGMWVYQEADFSSDLAELSQGIGPQYVMEILEMAESAEVVVEDGDYITYQLVLDFDQMVQGQDLEKMKEEFKRQGFTDEQLAGVVEMMRQIFSGMEMYMTVDKESGMATRFQIHMEMDFASLAAMFPEPLPQGAGMAMDADFEMSDYGKAFGLELPEEVKDAVPVEELEQQSTT